MLEIISNPQKLSYYLANMINSQHSLSSAGQSINQTKVLSLHVQHSKLTKTGVNRTQTQRPVKQLSYDTIFRPPNRNLKTLNC